MLFEGQDAVLDLDKFVDDAFTKQVAELADIVCHVAHRDHLVRLGQDPNRGYTRHEIEHSTDDDQRRTTPDNIHPQGESLIDVVLVLF